jgi:hypothetical protein
MNHFVPVKLFETSSKIPTPLSQKEDSGQRVENEWVV